MLLLNCFVHATMSDGVCVCVCVCVYHCVCVCVCVWLCMCVGVARDPDGGSITEVYHYDHLIMYWHLTIAIHR